MLLFASIEKCLIASYGILSIQYPFLFEIDNGPLKYPNQLAKKFFPKTLYKISEYPQQRFVKTLQIYSFRGLLAWTQDLARYRDGKFLYRCRWGGFCDYLDQRNRISTLEEWLKGYIPFYLELPIWSAPYFFYYLWATVKDAILAP